MALSALLLVGCGSMEDKESKTLEYYEANKEEASKKLEWCFEKVDMNKDAIHLAFENRKKKLLEMENPVKEIPSVFIYADFEVKLENYFESAKYDVKEELEKTKHTNKLNKVNRLNCLNAVEVIFSDEYENFSKKEFSELYKLKNKK